MPVIPVTGIASGVTDASNTSSVVNSIVTVAVPVMSATSEMPVGFCTRSTGIHADVDTPEVVTCCGRIFSPEVKIGAEAPTY
jgi:hypothetical protein